MAVEGLERIVREHPFFAGLDESFLELVVGCARNVRFEAGKYLFREGGPADQLYLVREGRVALEIAAPGAGATTSNSNPRPSRRIRAAPTTGSCSNATIQFSSIAAGRYLSLKATVSSG